MTAVAEMTRQARIDPARLEQVRAREDARLAERTAASRKLRERAARHLPGGVPMTWMTGLYRFPPIYVARGEGASFFDVDANSYLDFNVCDLSMTMGYGAKPIAEAVSRAVRQGAHYLLPVEDAVVAAEELAARVGLPHWQFTLSASGANAEVIRIARAMTGRETIIIFEGHYHGHLEETLVERGDDGAVEPELLGLQGHAARHTVILPFNDPAALEARLARGDVALVLTEPALTNCTLVHPDAGYLAQVRELTRRHGALLCYDEAHTFQFAFGGLVGAWSLECDFVVLGKGLGTGVSFALYGMSEAVAAFFQEHSDVDIGPSGLATGGTTYGSNIAAAAARAALLEVLTPEGYDRLTALGARLADGLDRLFRERGLPWTAHRLGPRSGYCLFPNPPRTGAEARRSIDVDFIDARRVYFANRGIWDSIASSGPQASFAHVPADIDRYVACASDFLSEVVA